MNLEKRKPKKFATDILSPAYNDQLMLDKLNEEHYNLCNSYNHRRDGFPPPESYILEIAEINSKISVIRHSIDMKFKDISLWDN